MQSNSSLVAPLVAPLFPGVGPTHSVRRVLVARAFEQRVARHSSLVGSRAGSRWSSIEGRSRPAASDEFTRLFERSQTRVIPSPGSTIASASQSDRASELSHAILLATSLFERLRGFGKLDLRRSSDPVWGEVMSFVVMASLIAAALLI